MNLHIVTIFHCFPWEVTSSGDCMKNSASITSRECRFRCYNLDRQHFLQVYLILRSTAAKQHYRVYYIFLCNKSKNFTVLLTEAKSIKICNLASGALEYSWHYYTYNARNVAHNSCNLLFVNLIFFTCLLINMWIKYDFKLLHLLKEFLPFVLFCQFKREMTVFSQ